MSTPAEEDDSSIGEKLNAMEAEAEARKRKREEKRVGGRGEEKGREQVVKERKGWDLLELKKE